MLPVRQPSGRDDERRQQEMQRRSIPRNPVTMRILPERTDHLGFLCDYSGQDFLPFPLWHFIEDLDNLQPLLEPPGCPQFRLLAVPSAVPSDP